MGEILPLTPLESLPLGYRFHPTDEELINHYLKRKINGRIKPCDAAVIPEVDVCRFEPWDLPDKSPIRSRDSEWFFFAPVDRKYPSGNRSNRSTEAGYWKSTGNDRMIKSKVGGGPTAALVGMKKTLVFYCGRAPKGTRTNWVMHEYRTVEPQGGFVLCRLFGKPEDVPPCSSNDEVQRTDFSSPNISSPGSLLSRANGVEESPTPLSRASPDSDLLEELQSLPEKIGKEMAGVNEVKQFIPHSSKPEEKQCINSMISDVGDHKGQTIGEELQSLPDIIGKEMSGINEVKRLTPHSFKLEEKQCTSNMTSDVGDRKCQTIGEEQKGRTVEPFIHFSDPQIPTKKQTEPLNALISLITARSSPSFSSPSKTLATLSSLRVTHSLIGSLISQIEDLVKDRDKPMDDLGEEIEEEELKFIEKVEEEARECVLQSKRRVSPLCSDGRAADRGKGPSSADPLDRGQ